VNRPARRIRAVLIAMLVAMLPLAATFGPAPARADDTTTPPALVVTLSSLRPVAPQPGDTLVLTGSIRNTTLDAVSGLAVQLRLGGSVGSRSEFDLYAGDPSAALPDNLSPVSQATAAVPDTRLLPGATQRFRISVDVDTLALPTTTWQVNELGIAATATTATGVFDTGALRTFLPWAPRTVSSTPVQVAWVWPLVDRPHRAVGTAWLDDDLASELTSTGRLGQLVAAADSAEHPAPRTTGRHHRHKVTTRGVPVTWAVDPMLVEDASLMAKGYTVQDGNGHTKPGIGRAAATTWLSALHAGVDNADVIPLPYADTDLVAAVRANLTGEVGVATASSRNLLTRALPTSRLLATAWPLDGLADSLTLDTMFGMEIHSVLLSSDALPIVGGEPNSTPSALTSVTTANGSLQTMLFDSGLTGIVNTGASDPPDSPLELQRFLAETLMIQAEAPSPSRPRSFVVAPSQRWQPGSSYASALLADSGQVPWIDAVPLSRVLSGPADDTVTRGPLVYPNSARRAELRPPYLRQVRTLTSRLAGFGTVLTNGTATVATYDSALQRLLSSAYRGDADGRQTALSAIRHKLSGQMSQVSITTHPGSFITLTSHRGTLPITIFNRLDTPVHVVLKVDANSRLGLVNGGRTTVPPIPANTSVSVTVRATAKTSGVFPLEVRLLTPSLRPYGKTVQLYVRSTAYGTITLVITAAATIALLIAVAIRLTRRGIAARRNARADA
jgi:Family of unknown function (DUF6049)